MFGSWLRDNCIIAWGLFYTDPEGPGSDDAVACLTCIARKYQSHKMEMVINGLKASPLLACLCHQLLRKKDVKGDEKTWMDRPHIRFIGETGLEDPKWYNHKQNDALGYFMWARTQLAWHKKLPFDGEHLKLMGQLFDYLRAIECWEDLDGGSEHSAVHASSVGPPLAAVKLFKKVAARDGFLPPCKSDTLDVLESNLQSALGKILPNEIIFPTDLARDSDSATVVDDASALQIMDRLKKVMGHIGMCRYRKDSYWCKDPRDGPSGALPPRDYKEKVGDDPTKHFTDEELKERDRLLKEGEEAQWMWVRGFDVVTDLLPLQFAEQDSKYLSLQQLFLARSLAAITGDSCPYGPWHCAEAYYLEKDTWVPNDDTPLVWTQVDLKMALFEMERSLALVADLRLSAAVGWREAVVRLPAFKPEINFLKSISGGAPPVTDDSAAGAEAAYACEIDLPPATWLVTICGLGGTFGQRRKVWRYWHLERLMPLLPAPESARSGKRSLQTVVEDIGIGPAQAFPALLGGGIWVADGSELLILGSVTKAVSDEWALNGFQRGMVVSIVFIGILLGNTSSGPLGDGMGRKLPILLSYLGIALFSVLSASATGFFSMAGVRMLVGFAFGLGQPATVALLNEVSPRRWRYLLMAQAMALFCVGELYAAWLIWLDDPMMKSLDWRWLCMVGAVPSIVGFVLAYFFLDESPAYLDENGYRQEALAALQSLKDRNGAHDVSCEYETSLTAQTPKSVRDHVATIFSRSLIFTTFTMMFSCLMLNLVFYGSLYAFPQVFTETNKTSYSPAVVLMIGAMVEWPGFFGAPIMEKFVTGKTIMLWCSSLCALSLLALVIGANGEGILYSLLLQGGYLGIKTTISITFVAAYTLAATAFPCAARTTGVAACQAAGRVGGIVAPLIFEMLQNIFQSWEPFFLVLAGGYLLNFVLLLPLKLDPEEDGEEQPLISSKAPGFLDMAVSEYDKRSCADFVRLIEGS
eukprot:s1128_g8.t2